MVELLLAAFLSVALIASLSETVAALLLTLWAVFTVLSLMALLERLRKGVARSGGGLSGGRIAALALRAAATGLLLASLSVAIARMATFGSAAGSVVVGDGVLEAVEERLE